MTKPYKIPESVLVVIHTSRLEVLLIERAGYPGFWQSVTGSKDSPDEPLADVAMREVYEETGIVVGAVGSELAAAGIGGRSRAAAAEQVAGAARHAMQAEATVGQAIVPEENLHDWQLSNVYTIYSMWRHRYAPEVTHNTEHVFSLLVPRDIPISLNPREHVNYQWLPHREAADKCFSSSNAEAILLLPQHLA